MLNKFTYRSDKQELLDDTSIDSGLLYKNLRELDILNRTTGGHAISLQGMKQIITDRNKTYRIVDLGCGSGDALKVIADWARRNNYRVSLTGVDRNGIAISYLRKHCIDYPEISGVTADYQDYLKTSESIDVVHCSLFCHHLSDYELMLLFQHIGKHIKTGFIINDLHRHWLAYYSAWLFTRLLNGTELSKNDGPVSVLRGFKADEISALLTKASIYNFSIQKKWLFRFLIVGKTAKNE
jgi:SAM-dependent methyltransferase